MQLVFGKLYTFCSIKWVFLSALVIFEIGSLVCGVTPNSLGLILGRAIAGIGAAGLFSGAILIIANSVPLEKRPLYTGIVGGMYGIASVAGPLYVISTFYPFHEEDELIQHPEWAELSQTMSRGVGASLSTSQSVL